MTLRTAPHRVIAVLAALLTLLASVPASSQVHDRRELKYPPLPAFRIPVPEVYTLQNGMKVFLLEDHELPLITATALIRTGSHDEPVDKVGLASIVGQVQRSGGTKTMPGDAMDEFLALRAASIETGIGSESGQATMNCLAENFDEVFRVFAEVLRNPAFPADKIDLAKVQEKTGIARRNDNVNAITSREFTRLIYGPDSPLARIPEYATVEGITREDLVRWHGTYYHPNNVLLGLVGDFRSADMKKKVEATLGKWPKGSESKLQPAKFRAEQQPGVFFIEKSDVNQTNIQMGHLGIRVTDPDYFAVQVMNEVLGGSFASRLFSNIRSKKGLAYSVYGGVGSEFTHPGIFSVGLQTKSGTTGEAVDALREEVAGLLSSPPTEEEIQRAKESILNSFVFRYDSKGEILGQQMLYAYYGLPLDFLEQYRANIEKATREDVTRAARKFVSPDKMTVLVVGKASDFDRPLTSFGKVQTVDITIPPPPDTRPKIERTEEGAATGRKILDRVVALIGGPDPQSLRSVRSSQTLAVSMGGPSMTLKQTQEFVYPDKLRQTIQTPMGEQIVVVNGNRGVAMGMGQKQVLSAPMIEDGRKDMRRELLLMARDQERLEAVAGGTGEVDGIACDIVSVTAEGAETRLCVAADGRVLRQSYSGKNPLTKAPAQIEVTYSDYRPVAGRQLPHKQVMRVDGQELVTITVDSIEINPTLEDKTFEVPEG